MGILHIVVLHFIALCRYCIFYKLKVCGNPAPSKSVGAILPASFAEFINIWNLPPIKSMTRWRLKWWLAFFFSNKVFLIRYVRCFLDVMLLPTYYGVCIYIYIFIYSHVCVCVYKVNITFLRTEKPKSLWLTLSHYSPYWPGLKLNPQPSPSKICLYCCPERCYQFRLSQSV